MGMLFFFLQPDRCTIVNYVINYVEYLQGKISDLTKVRAQLELDIESRENYASTTFRSQGISHCDKNIHKGNRHEGHEHLKGKEYRNGAQVPFSASVRYWGSMDIFISLRFPKRRGVWPDVLGLLEETFAIDVQCATFSSASNVCLHSIYAKVSALKYMLFPLVLIRMAVIYSSELFIDIHLLFDW